MNLNLYRIEKSDDAVIGILTLDGLIITDIYTLEHPTLLVPEGTYPIVWEHSPKFKCSLWELKNVPGRSECKLHKGTTMRDTEGCILVGQRVGYYSYPSETRQLRAIFYSGYALEDLHKLLTTTDQHTLKITGV